MSQFRATKTKKNGQNTSKSFKIMQFCTNFTILTRFYDFRFCYEFELLKVNKVAKS